MTELFNPRREAIVEIWNPNKAGVWCSTCGLVPETIYCCWLKDFKTKRIFLRYECYDCCEKIFKSPGFFPHFMEALKERLPVSVLPADKSLLFTADNFYCIIDRE